MTNHAGRPNPDDITFTATELRAACLKWERRAKASPPDAATLARNALLSTDERARRNYEFLMGLMNEPTPVAERVSADEADGSAEPDKIAA